MLSKKAPSQPRRNRALEERADAGQAVARQQMSIGPKPSNRKNRAPIDFESVSSAPYPSTDTSENSAITTFLGLLDHARVKAEVNGRDKRPNTDGHLDIVDKVGCSIGQVDVQIKTLSGNNLRARSYPCDLGLLKHCLLGASRQVLLIGVDIQGKQVFWLHLSREFIKQLKAKKTASSVSVKFPPDNTISSDRAYLEKWIHIVEAHSRKMALPDPMAAKLIEDKKSSAAIILSSTPSGTSYKSEFVVIQEFLDEINRLLDNDFKSVKEVLYPDTWKFGIAYSLFSRKNLCYSLFPIARGHNEPLIRQVNASIWSQTARRDNIDNIIHPLPFFGYSGNPIWDNPIREARARACAFAQEFISARALHLNDLQLAKELIFSIMDRNHVAFGLPQRDVYQLEELADGLYEYFPRWAGYAVDKCCPNREIPTHLCGRGPFVDFDALRKNFARIANLSSASFQRTVRKREAPNDLPQIGSDIYPLGIFRRHLAFLADENVTSVERPYLRPSNLGGDAGGSRRFSELWQPKDFASNFKIVMNSLLETYNRIIEYNFPMLQSRLSYFRNFDRVVIVACHKNKNFGPGWDVTTYFLKGPTHPLRHLAVYCEGIDILPALTENQHNTTVEFDGEKYRIVAVHSEICTMNFFRQPLFQAVLSLLKERFEQFTREWLTEDTL